MLSAYFNGSAPRPSPIRWAREKLARRVRVLGPRECIPSHGVRGLRIADWQLVLAIEEFINTELGKDFMDKDELNRSPWARQPNPQSAI